MDRRHAGVGDQRDCDFIIQQVAPSAFTGWALLVTVLALVDWKEFGDDRAKGLHVREVRFLAIEHLVATLVLSVGR